MISDLYIVNWLLQNTENGSIIWQRRDYGMFFVNLGEGVSSAHIELGIVQSRPMARIVVKFKSFGLGEVEIHEPLQSVFSFSRKYDSEDERELAEAMNGLMVTTARKLAQKQLEDIETEAERKQEIFKKLIRG